MSSVSLLSKWCFCSESTSWKANTEIFYFTLTSYTYFWHEPLVIVFITFSNSFGHCEFIRSRRIHFTGVLLCTCILIGKNINTIYFDTSWGFYYLKFLECHNNVPWSSSELIELFNILGDSWRISSAKVSFSISIFVDLFTAITQFPCNKFPLVIKY